MTVIFKHLPALTLAISIVAFAILISDTIFVEVEMTGAEPNTLQIFWSDEKGRIGEKRSKQFPTGKFKKKYSLTLAHGLQIKRMRIDLQGGVGNVLPKDIILHSISVSSRWFYQKREFNKGLAGFDAVSGMKSYQGENGEYHISFTNNDPILEFDLDLQFHYFRLFLVLFSLFGLHFAISSSMVKGRKRSLLVRVECVLEDIEVDELLALWKKKKLLSRPVRCSCDNNKYAIYFLTSVVPVEKLYKQLKESGTQVSFLNMQVVANRSGEVQ